MPQDYFLTAIKEITDVRLTAVGRESYLGPYIPFYDFWILTIGPCVIVGVKKRN